MASLFKNPRQWVSDTSGSTARNFQNAGRGEIGKFVSGAGQSAFNLAAAPVRAVSTGNYSKELQRATGSYLNLASYNRADYLGQSSGAQRVLNKDPIYGRNLGAYTHGVSTTARSGELSNRDRNYIVQGGIKTAAVVGAGLLLAPAAPSAAAGGDIFASAGPGAAPGVLSAPAYGSSGAAASSSIGASSLSASSAGTAAAATGGSGILSTVSKFAETLGITTAVSKFIGNKIAGSPQGTTSESVPLPFFGGPDSGSGPIFNVPGSSGGGSYGALNPADLNKVALFGALAVGTLLALKATKVI